MFGVVFPELSFPMDISSFSQIDPLHWLLDISSMAGEAYHSVKEVCIFLLNPTSLPAGKALAVYAQPPSGPFLFCGALHGSRPSALLRLPWPDPADVAAAPTGSSAKIGVSMRILRRYQQWQMPGRRRRRRGWRLRSERISSISCNRFVGLMGIDWWFRWISWINGSRNSRKDPVKIHHISRVLVCDPKNQLKGLEKECGVSCSIVPSLKFCLDDWGALHLRSSQSQVPAHHTVNARHLCTPEPC
ncbi:putative OPI10 family protein [Dioscorea sansibarensis]